MKIKKAVVTAAGRGQKALPLQTLVDRDGQAKSALQLLHSFDEGNLERPETYELLIAYLDHPALLREFGITREAAILSSGSAEADPLCLAHTLLAAAVRRGATLYDGEATRFEANGGGLLQRRTESNRVVPGGTQEAQDPSGAIHRRGGSEPRGGRQGHR